MNSLSYSFFFFQPKIILKKSTYIFAPDGEPSTFVVYKDQDQFKGNVQFSADSVDIDSMLDCTYSVLYHDFSLYLQGNSI